MKAEQVLETRFATEALCAIWCRVLQRVHVNVDDDFFELGGNSVHALEITASVRSIMTIDMPLRWIFESPTIAQLAQRVVHATGSGVGDDRTETL
jgi:hypothetical protein